MTVGEKICLYRERLGFRNFADFSKAVGLKGDWLLEMSKKDSIKMVDMENVIVLCEYLSITIDQLVKDEEIKIEKIETLDKEDLSVILKEIVSKLDNSEIRLDGIKLNDKAKSVLKDSLEVCKQLTRQYL